MLRSVTSLLATLALVAAPLGFAGCGGSSHHTAASSPAPATSAPASSKAPATSNHQPSSAGGSSADPRSVPSQCVAGSDGDPAEFTICLAKHGVHLSADDGKLTTCVESASNKDDLDRCLSEAASR
jgi:hypothetical protein